MKIVFVLFLAISSSVLAASAKPTGAECRFFYTSKIEPNNSDVVQVQERRAAVSFLKFRDAAEDRIGDFILGMNVLDTLDEKSEIVPNILSVNVSNASDREPLGEVTFGTVWSPLAYLPGDAQISTVRPPGMGFVQFSCYLIYTPLR